jgi:hypothetical protein
MGRQSRRKRERQPVTLKAEVIGNIMLATAKRDGPEPHYVPVMRELLRRHGEQVQEGIRRGRRYEVQTLHDDWCPTLRSGGVCVCEPVCRIVEIAPPEFN